MVAPPSGTVTFLFTDIEGSTRHWERSPEAMSEALARHDEILTGASEAYGGHVFKTVGDAFCCAFPTASEALEAALAAQRALLAEEWVREVGAIRVRMALHAGAAEERGGDYFGPPLNRVARLLSAGHGGQVLLSHAAQELVRDELPEGADLRDLGEQRLKDLFRPERIFQLHAPDLPFAFAPLKTLDARLNNLPVQPTPLVGREKEVAEVCGRLRRPDVRLLTLTGPGGTGKTRLGLQVAAELLDEFEGGVFFVTLAPVSDPDLVASTIAGPLGVVESGEQPLEESLKDYLRNRELLLLLDNFEQVLQAAPLVGEILSVCPSVKVLATSRATLRIHGEQEYAVPPLALPDPKRLPPVEKLGQYEAVRLFIERARAVKADFEVTNDNAPALAGICSRLDGLPLAIELAAARTRLLSPEAMLARLGSRLKLLKGGARDLPARQQTLRSTIEWSHDLLDEEERALFRRLSVFVGGFTLETAEEVCDAGGEPEVDVLDGADSLLGKSLLRQDEKPDEERFFMLETIREYALERLDQSGETGELRDRHAEHYLALAEEAEPELLGSDQVAWLERLDAEHDNMRAALSWMFGGYDAALGTQLAGTLGGFWMFRAHLREGQRWLEKVLDGDGSEVPASVRAKALTNAGWMAAFLGEQDRGWALAEEGAALYRETGDKRGLAEVLDVLGYVASDRGEWNRADACYWEGLNLRRGLGDKERVSMSLSNLGYSALLQEDYVRATELLEESLASARETENERNTAIPLLNLGWVALGEGDHARAAQVLDESLTLHRELDIQSVIVECLEAMAALAGLTGKGWRSARLWGAAEALRQSLDFPVPVGDRPRYESYQSVARTRLGDVEWSRAWEEGQVMRQEAAVVYALEDDQDAGNAPTGEGAEPA